MTLLQLTYVLALDRFRNFRLAAESCHVTQPSLSMQIQKLEEELGVILFDRTARPVVPTEIGTSVIEQARNVMVDVERLHELTQEVTGKLAGELRVGVLSTISPYLIPLVITPFIRDYPGIILTSEELPAGPIIEQIKRDQLDAGILATATATPSLVEDLLFEEPFVGYVSPRHRLYRRKTIQTNDLQADDLWLMSEGHCFRDQTLELVHEDSPDNRTGKTELFESSNLETLQRLVDRGYGMTLLPWLAVQGEGSHAPESVRLFKEPAPTRTIRLVFSRTSPKKHLIHALAAAIREAVVPFLPERYVIPPRSR